jgi:hypothetical protein
MKFAFCLSRIHMRSWAHNRFRSHGEGARASLPKGETALAFNEGAIPMDLGTKNMTVQIARATKKAEALLARYIGRLVAARKRRTISEQELRSSYEARCGANSLRPVWVKDWKEWRPL